jgi:hypothetical protein
VPHDSSFTWRPRTILLVDDEAAVRTVAARALRADGHLVVEAASAPEALSVAEQHQGEIDLLVTDLVMRGMGGRELAQQLRAGRPTLRILFMSGYSLEQLEFDPAAVNAEFMEKPFAPADLSERVSALMNT